MGVLKGEQSFPVVEASSAPRHHRSAGVAACAPACRLGHVKKGTPTDWQRLSQAPEVEGSGKDVLCSPQACGICGSVIGTGLVEFVEIPSIWLFTI